MSILLAFQHSIIITRYFVPRVPNFLFFSCLHVCLHLKQVIMLSNKKRKQSEHIFYCLYTIYVYIRVYTCIRIFIIYIILYSIFMFTLFTFIYKVSVFNDLGVNKKCKQSKISVYIVYT